MKSSNVLIGCCLVVLVAALSAPASRCDAPAAVEKQAVESDLLNSVTYDGATHTLTLAFDDGSIYEFYAVDRSVFLDLVRVVNKGEYFNAHIRNVFRYRRVGGGSEYQAQNKEEEEGTCHR
jgi:hypothetical protein